MDVDGILLVDKEVGRTSFETLKIVKKSLGVKKAGHAGTLDKFASGLLIVCINRGTSVQNLLMSQVKKYRAQIYLGVETDTLDRYGRIVKTGPVRETPRIQVEQVLSEFTGVIDQIPPVFSAIRYGGKRLYKRALNGESVDVRPRRVEIRRIECIGIERNRIDIEVVCSKGTYIRSLARDVAESLGTCGFLQELRRLSIGRFFVQDAYKPVDIDRTIPIMPLYKALDIYPGFEVTGEQLPLIYKGVPIERLISADHPIRRLHGYVRLLHAQRLVALLEVGETLRYYRVFIHN